eukprot:TRINITY_DN28544_c0_g1_i1.p3 TRINITY_DN28544_c0_g1~~TRINITY_DN28544_c0_g1_i1.p3  ORF type:complete len:143 (+),score=5.13 TRINITY_DN28544_c0_g1_i1:49-477(+)
MSENSSVDYASMQIKELKELLKDKGLKVGGTKAVLIERLTEADSSPKRKGNPKAGPKPKGAKSGYMFFSIKRGAEIRADPEHKDKKLGEVAKMVGAEWKELSDDEKKPYLEQAAADKIRAKKELDTWKENGGVDAPKKKKKK